MKCPWVRVAWNWILSRSSKPFWKLNSERTLNCARERLTKTRLAQLEAWSGLFHPIWNRHGRFSAAKLAAAQDSLPEKLSALRKRSNAMRPDNFLKSWGVDHLGLVGGAAEEFARRAWWGAAAGELLRVYLGDRQTRSEALALSATVDWSQVDAVQGTTGLIVATAHLGPPKYLMNMIADHRPDSLVVTNVADMPAWLPEIGGRYLCPMAPERRARVAVELALHLRQGGLIFAAPDGMQGDETVVIRDIGRDWTYATGLPLIARRFGSPGITLLALWKEDRIVLEASGIETPAVSHDATSWMREWLECHHEHIRSVVFHTPENLRFLGNRFRKRFGN